PAELHGSSSRTIGGSGKHHPIMVNRCRTVDSHPVGGPLILPQELSISSRNPNERLGGKLHILALPIEVDCDWRGVGCSRRPGTAEAAEATTGTTSTTVSTARSTTQCSGSAVNPRIHHAPLKSAVGLPNLTARIG